MQHFKHICRPSRRQHSTTCSDAPMQHSESGVFSVARFSRNKSPLKSFSALGLISAKYETRAAQFASIHLTLLWPRTGTSIEESTVHAVNICWLVIALWLGHIALPSS